MFYETDEKFLSGVDLRKVNSCRTFRPQPDLPTYKPSRHLRSLGHVFSVSSGPKPKHLLLKPTQTIKCGSTESPEHQLNMDELIWNSPLSPGDGRRKGQRCQTGSGHVLFSDLLSAFRVSPFFTRYIFHRRLYYDMILQEGVRAGVCQLQRPDRCCFVTEFFFNINVFWLTIMLVLDSPG